MSSDLDPQVEGLRRMSREQLKKRWRELYRAAPPVALTPDLLARGLAATEWPRHRAEEVGRASVCDL